MKKKENIIMAFLMAVTFIFITVSGIIHKQQFLKILPLYISLAVSLLQSRINRYAPLVGGINAVIYALAYFSFRLYASAAYALFLSCPLQLITFILWNRHPWKNSTMLKKLSARQRIMIIAAAAAAWLIIQHMLSGADSTCRELDTAVTILGFLETILTLLSYYEYTAAKLGGGLCSMLLFVSMLKDYPEQTTYLGYSVYLLICSTIAVIRVRKIYAEQQNIMKQQKERKLI